MRNLTSIWTHVFNLSDCSFYVSVYVVCQQPLGVESGDLPNMRITSSSDAGTGKESWRCRLNAAEAWCAGNNTYNEYLELDLGRVRTISRVATQGHAVKSHWVKVYQLSYSTDGIFWRKALGEDKSKVWMSLCLESVSLFNTEQCNKWKSIDQLSQFHILAKNTEFDSSKNKRMCKQIVTQAR